MAKYYHAHIKEMLFLTPFVTFDLADLNLAAYLPCSLHMQFQNCEALEAMASFTSE